MNSKHYLRHENPNFKSYKKNLNLNELLKDYKIEGLISRCKFGEIKSGIHLKTNEKVCSKYKQYKYNKSLKYIGSNKNSSKIKNKINRR